jgi:hypothetical protein
MNSPAIASDSAELDAHTTSAHRSPRMNVTIWLSAGAAAGWIASSILGLNAARAFIVSLIVGAVGTVFGGDAIAPPFSGSSIGTAAVLTPFAVLVASIAAIACLKILGIVLAPPPRYCSPLEDEQ